MGEEQLRSIIRAALAGDFEAEDEVVAYAARRVLFWETHLERLMGWKDPLAVREWARERAMFEGLNAKDAIKDLLFLGALLSDDPILVNSGQWLPTYDRPRSYSDVEGEIASRLVNQPQFHAICKIIRNGRPEEHELRTAGYLPTVPTAEDTARLERIRARSRLLYCRPRNEVEAELLRRQSLDDNGPNRVTRVTNV
jgi:hypothetical protein